MLDSPGSEYAITLWVRDTTSHRWIVGSSIDDRLNALREAGVIEGVTRRLWGGHIPCERSEDGFQLPSTVSNRERFTTFQAWADTRGYSLAPGFRKCERTSMVTDRTESVIVPPIVCLAVYREATLVGVYPCSNGERTITVGDCLDAFETNGEPPFIETLAKDSGDFDKSIDWVPDTADG